MTRYEDIYPESNQSQTSNKLLENMIMDWWNYRQVKQILFCSGIDELPFRTVNVTTFDVIRVETFPVADPIELLLFGIQS